MIREKVLSLLSEIDSKTGGHCGIIQARMVNEIGCNIKDLKPVLRKLYEEDLIRVNDGVHGKLIRLNRKNFL